MYYKLILAFDKENRLKTPLIFESKKKDLVYIIHFWNSFLKCEGLSLKFKVSLNDSVQYFHSTAFLLSAMGTGTTAHMKVENSQKTNIVIHLGTKVGTLQPIPVMVVQKINRDN